MRPEKGLLNYLFARASGTTRPISLSKPYHTPLSLLTKTTMLINFDKLRPLTQQVMSNADSRISQVTYSKSN